MAMLRSSGGGAGSRESELEHTTDKGHQPGRLKGMYGNVHDTQPRLLQLKIGERERPLSDEEAPSDATCERRWRKRRAMRADNGSWTGACENSRAWGEILSAFIGVA
ncbi:hypothetical protein H107_07428 [Trichophyton rubrum CBS 202.88]|nr:hypothetical protein H110_07268 [Trichophyton rubrum MR1448]EZG13404.1 hypothetical protein H107_07428 [Trichophyton rubrum CBS 202.88]